MTDLYAAMLCPGKLAALLHAGRAADAMPVGQAWQLQRAMARGLLRRDRAGLVPPPPKSESLPAVAQCR